MAAQIIVGVITNMLPRPTLPEGAEESGYQRRLAAVMRDCWAHEAAARPGFNTILDALDRIADDFKRPE